MCQPSIWKALLGKGGALLPTSSHPSIFVLAMAMGSVLCSGCDSVTGPKEIVYDPSPIVELTISPDGTTLQGVGSTFLFACEGRSAAGSSVSYPEAVWSSLNPRIATVHPTTGEVTAVAAGQVTIMAEGNGATSYAVVNVSLPELQAVSQWRFDNEPRPWLTAIWGSSATDVYVVGAFGVIHHFDGVGWTEISTEGGDYLADVWGTSSTDVFAVGSHGTILHYDGAEWSQMESGTSEDMAGVWGTNSQDVFAVGGNTVFHYDGTGWSAIDPGIVCRFSDVRGSSPDDVFVIGCSGTILHWDGSDWSGSRRAVDSSRLDELWVNAEDDVFLAGTGMWHFDGAAWTEMEVPYSYLRAVWGTPSGETFAVGSSGTVLHYDGTAWTEMQTGTDKVLEGVWGSSAENVFAVGEGNTILHYDGTSWSTVRTGLSAAFPSAARTHRSRTVPSRDRSPSRRPALRLLPEYSEQYDLPQ